MLSATKTLNSKIIYQNKWIRLNEDEVLFPDGSKGIYAFMDRMDNGAMIIPMTDDGKLVLLKEWRYPVKDVTWCFPAGGRDKADEEAVEVAKRELLEETGIIAGELVDLGAIWIDPGINSQRLPVFLAKDLAFAESHPEISEQIEIHKLTIEEVEDLVRSGEINNGWVLSCLMKLFVYLKKV
jgi:8-oxo-dGTP pyrophosphatase MutT (NUDIX family)